VPKIKRLQGRPRGGRARIAAGLIRFLPLAGNPHAFAKVLRVTDTTMRQWLATGAPCEILPKAGAYTARMLTRGPFVRWLKKTGRIRT
jgi:hypothetical protein